MHVDICKSNCIVKKKIEIEKKQPLALKKKIAMQQIKNNVK